MKATCSAIVPFRATSPARSENLITVLRWLTEVPVSVVVSEHSAQSEVDLTDFPEVRSVWEKSTGAFSKSAACNAGVVVASTPVIALVDADTMVQSRALRACINRIVNPGERESIQAIRPFGRLIDLGENQSRNVQETGELPRGLTDASDAFRSSEHIPLAGGILVIEREAYLSIGGMDESFLGWGGEDDAFSSALKRCGVKGRILTPEVGYHLWHNRDAKPRYQHENYATNVRRAMWWRESSPEDFDSAVANGRQALLDRQR